jgi:hypothetical protein
MDSENFGRVRDNARRALEAVRHFQGRVTDPVLWRQIQERADQLEKLLSKQ